jgi:hypothetical protein
LKRGGGILKNLSLFVLLASIGLVTGCGRSTSLYKGTAGTGSVWEQSEGRSIWKAKPRTPEQQKTYAAVVRLHVGDALCSASHIGKGVLLTAFHCISSIADAKKGEEPPMGIYSPVTKTSIGPVESYELSAPEVEKLQPMPTRKGEKPQFNRLPDLALIKFLGDDKDKLAALPVVTLGTETLKVGDDDLHLAGYGLESFGTIVQVGPFGFFTPPKKGSLNSGDAKISKVDDFAYEIEWKKGDDTSAALPGDSGGPLLKVLPDGTLVAYGVVSTLGMGNAEEDEEAMPDIRLKNAYMRLDRQPLREWLDKALAE